MSDNVRLNICVRVWGPDYEDRARAEVEFEMPQELWLGDVDHFETAALASARAMIGRVLRKAAQPPVPEKSDDGKVLYRRPCNRCGDPVDQPIQWDGAPVCAECLQSLRAYASDAPVEPGEELV